MVAGRGGSPCALTPSQLLHNKPTGSVWLRCVSSITFRVEGSDWDAALPEGPPHASSEEQDGEAHEYTGDANPGAQALACAGGVRGVTSVPQLLLVR